MYVDMALQAKTIKPAGTGLDKNSSDIPNIEKSEPAEADTLLKILEEQNRLVQFSFCHLMFVIKKVKN